jgi:hypothetical protein
MDAEYLETSISLNSLQRQGYEVIAVWTLQLDRIAFPPGEVSSKLEGGKAGEGTVAEESAQAARVVTTDLESITLLMAGRAAALHVLDCGDDLHASTWICRHRCYPSFLVIAERQP